MHHLMAALDVFANHERYARFVLAQCLFLQRVRAWTASPQVAAWVPDVAERNRLADARADLMDLSDNLPYGWEADVQTAECAAVEDARFASLPSTPVAPAGAYPDAGFARALLALGWLYVSEGSTLGASFLFKTAQSRLGLSVQLGARHLAAPVAGRAAAWKRFTYLLDQADLTGAQHDLVVAGAHQAFAFFAAMLRCAFNDQNVLAPQPLTGGV
jgi:heme oxygenase